MKHIVQGVPDFLPLLLEGKLDNIGAHLEGSGSLFLRVAMHIRVLPAITQIALIGIKTDQSPLVKQTKSLWRLPVMFVNLGQSLGEIKFGVKDGVIEREFDEIQLWKYFFHGNSDIGVHTVIIIDVQKSAPQQVIP